ncbi:hypothetical protein EON65_13695 [archaeon]|nr:MAG: hypothetical protein EON65_13695 [archaeon]
MRCPLFRGSSGPIVNRLVNFFHLLNQSPGKDVVARRSRSAEIIVFRPPERAAVHRTANFARNGQVIPVATAVLVPSSTSSNSSTGGECNCILTP